MSDVNVSDVTESGGPPRQLFVRRSTGLVREASALDATIFNAVFSAPVGATLAWGVFFALHGVPRRGPGHRHPVCLSSTSRS